MTTESKPHNRVQFRADPSLAAWLTERAQRDFTYGTLADLVKRELDAWRVVLDLERARTRWTIGELCAMADVCNGSMMSSLAFGNLLAGELAEAFDQASAFGEISSYGTKWNIDERALLTKALSLGPAADHATRDGLARFWAAPSLDASDPQTWKRLGFTVLPQ